MKYAVIDVGSNSVRLMVSDGERTIYKKINTTRLALGLSLTGNLDVERMEETAAAIEEYVKEANEQKCDGIYVFATEAVRSARNRRDFVDMLWRPLPITAASPSPLGMGTPRRMPSWLISRGFPGSEDIWMPLPCPLWDGAGAFL